MDEAWIGRPAAGLRFRPVDVEPDGSVASVEALLRTDGLEARRVVVHHYSKGFADLAGFFTEMERDWRGWEGERTFESLEGDLLLSAAHDGHVVLGVALRQSTIPDGWSVRAVLRLEPGEELAGVAAGVRALFSSSA
jgi:hypothetical protein